MWEKVFLGLLIRNSDKNWFKMVWIISRISGRWVSRSARLSESELLWHQHPTVTRPRPAGDLGYRPALSGPYRWLFDGLTIHDCTNLLPSLPGQYPGRYPFSVTPFLISAGAPLFL